MIIDFQMIPPKKGVRPYRKATKALKTRLEHFAELPHREAQIKDAQINLHIKGEKNGTLEIEVINADNARTKQLFYEIKTDIVTFRNLSGDLLRRTFDIFTHLTGPDTPHTVH